MSLCETNELLIKGFSCLTGAHLYLNLANLLRGDSGGMEYHDEKRYLVLHYKQYTK